MQAGALTGVRILVVNRDSASAAALCASLDSAGPAACTYAASVATALEQDQSPDLCVLAAEHGASIADDIAALEAGWPRTPVVVLASVLDEDEFVEALSAGASGYLPASMNREQLIAGLCDVMGGLPVLPRRFTARLVRELKL